MSSCNLIEPILASECLGDSLPKINNNFQNLNNAVCETVSPKSGRGISIEFETTEQGKSQFITSTQNSFTYNTRFDSFNNGATINNVFLADGTSLETTKFPYVSSVSDSKPIATFTATSLTDTPPQLTLYWFASGGTNINTVYPLNSAANETNKGGIWFNGTVNALLSSGNSLYVGGAFTQVGGTLQEKFAELDIDDCNGSIIPNPINALGSYGEVKKIITATATRNLLTKQLIALGGSFESIGIRGRSLLIYNKTDNLFYPFYVNGEVNALQFLDGYLIVGGKFDYVNYGSSSNSVYSGQRLITNGLFKINLSDLLAGLGKGALTDISSVFSGPATINEIISTQAAIIYIGGDFKVKESNKIVCQNFCSMTTEGDIIPSSNLIINGPVYTLYVDNDIATGGSIYLYVGGEFSKCYTNSQYYVEPRVKNSSSVDFKNALALKLTESSSYLAFPNIVSNWKPNFENAITSFVSHNNSEDSYIYCYGKQTSVTKSANYLIAVKKASSYDYDESNWNPSIQNSPSFINRALLKVSNGLLVGGNFTKVGTHYRYNLAKISDIDSMILLGSLSSVSWDIGAQVITPGLPITLNTSSPITVRAINNIHPFPVINATTFPIITEGFEGLTRGQLLRFFVKRPGKSDAVSSLLSATDDSFKREVNVVGWKLDFNR